MTNSKRAATFYAGGGLQILPDLIQGTPEWDDQRRGIVTASVVSRLLSTGAPDASTVACPTCSVEVGPCLSVARKVPTLLKTVHTARSDAAGEMPAIVGVASNDTSRALTVQLVAERITGHTDHVWVNADMERGTLHEPIARDYYSEQREPVDEVGFMIRTEAWGTLGFSPDGLVRDEGAIEIKAPRAKTHIQTVLADEVPAQHMPQIQAGLLVSGRAWLDFISFCAGLPLFVKRVYPDPDWFAAITAAVQQFETAAADMQARYQGAVAGLPPTDYISDDLELKL